MYRSELESSRTYFEVLGLGLEASSSRKLPSPRLKYSSLFRIDKIVLKNARYLVENLQRPFCFPLLEIAGKKILKTFFLKKFLGTFFVWRTFALVSLVLGLDLEHSCPWPLEGLSSERLSLALASDFFVSLALASTLVSLTPPLVPVSHFCNIDPLLKPYCYHKLSMYLKKLFFNGQFKKIKFKPRIDLGYILIRQYVYYGLLFAILSKTIF